MKRNYIISSATGLFLFLVIKSPAQVTEFTPEIERRIQKVENSLMGWVQTGDTLKWSLESRMKQYNVPGLSLAVINDNRIECGQKAMDLLTFQKTDR